MNTYTYDSANRLTSAEYSTGEFYHYTYDSVGNRLTQDSTVNGLSSSVSYNYDIANRLADVDGVSYVYDANGNASINSAHRLLNDGTNDYVYDSANRLISVSGQSTVSSYQYSGLGDRLSQTVGGQVANYTLDLNSGLTQVLDDGTNTYTYGLGRISQTNTTTEYFLGDALGSVRQLTSQSGQVTYAKSYDPYGVVAQVSGVGQSAYGYTGEQQSNDMVYLRSRYYNVNDGRFQSRDTWSGSYHNPITLNRWAYANDNPVTLTDPSGHCPWCPIILPIIGIIIIASSTSGCSSTPTQPSISSYVAVAEQPIVLERGYYGEYLYPSGEAGVQELHFGDQAVGKNGITFVASVDVPSGLDGTVEFTQNIMADVQMQRKDGETESWPKNKGWMLDTELIYHGLADEYLNITPTNSGEMKLITEDTPFIPLYSRWKQVSLEEHFKMYIMWRPRGATDEERIPLKVLNWSWKTVLENRSENRSDWRIVHSEQSVGLGIDASDNPILSPNIENDLYPLP